jgi:mannitol/fructose-specific phosphotransferase system IIA component (Ntr-type)
VKAPGLEKLTVAIGISEEGVDFNALDKQPVHSIFLLISPEERPEEHIDAMEAIFGNLSRDQFRRFLRQAGSVEEILTLLDEADSGNAVG